MLNKIFSDFQTKQNGRDQLQHDIMWWITGI